MEWRGTCKGKEDTEKREKGRKQMCLDIPVWLPIHLIRVENQTGRGNARHQVLTYADKDSGI